MRHLDNQKFNLLTVIGLAKVNRNGNRYWDCICECGNKAVVSTDHLTRKKNPVQSCGCVKFYRGDKHRDWKGIGEISGSWWAMHVAHEIKQKKRKPVAVDLTLEEAWKLFERQDKKCALSGISLKFSSKAYFNTASLDRIDSSKGYELGNVQWVHKHVNFMKRDFEQNYFIDLCKKIVENKT